jgi:type IV secretory pathway VirB4 component
MPNQSTHSIVEIADIRDNIVLLRNGSLRIVLEVSAINFELRSEDEQSAIIQSFQNFLNSIDFPIQIVVQSKRYNIRDYLDVVEKASNEISNELLKIQAEEYMKFIQELSTLSNIMSKRFYIVIPFYLVESHGKGGILDTFKGLFKTTKSISSIPEENFATYQNQLVQRAELIYDSLVGSGLKGRILEKEELTSLFYQLYNPGAVAPVKLDQNAGTK